MLVAHMARIYCGTSHKHIHTCNYSKYNYRIINAWCIVLLSFMSSARIHDLTIPGRVSCVGACITDVDDQILQKALQALIKVRDLNNRVVYRERFILCLGNYSFNSSGYMNPRGTVLSKLTG